MSAQVEQMSAQERVTEPWRVGRRPVAVVAPNSRPLWPDDASLASLGTTLIVGKARMLQDIELITNRRNVHRVHPRR